MTGDKHPQMSDRLSGRVESTEAKHLFRGSGGEETRDDSSALHTAVDQPVPPRIVQLLQSLTDLDHAIIDLLVEVRIATGNQLNRLFWPPTASGSRAARRRLKRLSDLRVLTRLDRQIGGVKGGSQGYTYALDVNGQRIAQSLHHNTIRKPTPSDPFVDHAIAVTETYVALHTTPGVETLAYQSEPACWRQFTGAAGRTVTLRPDAYAQWAIDEWELSAFFEVDRATEHPGRIARKADQYLRYWRSGQEQRTHDVYPTVLWVTPTQKRADVLRRVLAEHEAGPLCAVITDHEITTFITNTSREEGTP